MGEIKICIASHNYPLKNGKFDKFRAGKEYDPADYKYELIDKYFKDKSDGKSYVTMAGSGRKSEVKKHGNYA